MTEDERAGIKAMLLHAEKYGHEQALMWIQAQYMLQCMEFNDLPVTVAMEKVNTPFVPEADSTEEAVEGIKEMLAGLEG